MKVTLAELEKTINVILASKHYSDEEAKQITEVLMYGELMGKNTQGILKLMGTEPAQDIKPHYPAKFVKDHKLAAILDGGGTAGPLAAQLATKKAIEKAKEHGMSIVAVNNVYSSIGAVGFYANKLAERGLVGIVTANCDKCVNYNNIVEPVFGTNPIAFGFPTETNPIVFDMATAAISFYGLVRAKKLGEPLPENVAIDSNGDPTTDPQKAMSGAILPFDRSYKSSGLALTVEMLSGVLTGAAFSFHEDNEKNDWGALIIAIDPEILIGTAQFKKRATELVDTLKASKTSDGTVPHIPGFDTFAKRDAIIKSGEIDVPAEVWKELQDLV